MPIWDPNVDASAVAGHPRRDHSLSRRLSEIGDEPAGAARDADVDTTLPPTRRDLLLRSLWQRAIDGDLGAARLIFEYCDGRPVERSRAATLSQPLNPITADDLAAVMAGAQWELSRLGTGPQTAAEGSDCPGQNLRR